MLNQTYSKSSKQGEFKQANSGFLVGERELLLAPTWDWQLGFDNEVRVKRTSSTDDFVDSWSNFHRLYLSNKIIIIITIIILITTRSTVITATFTTLARSRFLRASPEAFPGRFFRSAGKQKKGPSSGEDGKRKNITWNSSRVGGLNHQQSSEKNMPAHRQIG